MKKYYFYLAVATFFSLTVLGGTAKAQVIGGLPSYFYPPVGTPAGGGFTVDLKDFKQYVQGVQGKLWSNPGDLIESKLRIWLYLPGATQFDPASNQYKISASIVKEKWSSISMPPRYNPTPPPNPITVPAPGTPVPTHTVPAGGKWVFFDLTVTDSIDVVNPQNERFRITVHALRVNNLSNGQPLGYVDTTIHTFRHFTEPEGGGTYGL